MTKKFMRLPAFQIFKSNPIHVLLFIVAGAVMVVNAVLAYKAEHKVNVEQKAAEEAAKPAEIALTVLSTPQCAECFDVNALINPLKSNDKIKVTGEKTVEYTADEGVALVQKYGITRVPTLIVQGNTGKAFDEASFIQNLGKKAEDGTLIVMNVPAPYLDVASGAVKGKFVVTYVTDKSCKECYDPVSHRQALAGLAMKATAEKFVDRSDAEGRRLIAQYGITSAPTIILTGELAEYPNFQQVWPQVGTTEKDGAYVFRSGQQYMGKYHDLKTGKVVTPKPADTGATSAAQSSH